jgi:hypothetical protein
MRGAAKAAARARRSTVGRSSFPLKLLLERPAKLVELVDEPWKLDGEKLESERVAHPESARSTPAEGRRRR